MNKILTSILILSAIYFSAFQSVVSGQTKSGKYTIVVHGGAGGFPENAPDSMKQAYLNSLSEALTIGKNILANGGSSLDAVEKVINYLEDNPLFNAGRGGVFTSEGKHELDASIMFGKDLSTGAVAGVTIIKNPISLARLVMEKTEHVLFAGKGADELGLKLGVPVVHNSYFHNEEQYLNWLKSGLPKQPGETVGCVAIDQYGNITAGTSTGGRQNKMPGRVGDSPLINAGTYADNRTCGVSATGIGELFIRHTVAYRISALMELKGYSLKQACEEVMYKTLPEGAGGIIAVDKDGNYKMIFTTPAMFRAVANSEGVFQTAIWK
ncbi:isoaspartyl peptidase/L-asparaginase family protein [Ignavibacterium album]|uniref:isoaspartyl peptidase/L-asparaginase family protein n=1 Tax=Ignavibacterium album TaxID=591197 RepID=UPI0035B7198B